MTSDGAQGAVVTSAVVVAGVWGYRKLVEPATAASSRASQPSQALLKIIGAEPRPASTAEFAVAFGFVYLVLSLTATFAPTLAGSIAILVAVGELLTNGASVATDVMDQVAEGAKTTAGEAHPASSSTRGRGK